MKDKAYLCGVLLGDGFFGCNGNGTHAYLMLKAVDRDFVEKFRDTIEKVTGKTYSVYSLKEEHPKHKPLFLCKCYATELVAEFKEITRDKSMIPNFIMDGDDTIKKSFLQGLMDSEGWITVILNSLKISNIALNFGNTASWTKDVCRMFNECGITTSKIYTKNQQEKKALFWFSLDIMEYINAGMTFNIKRKRNRLNFASRILNDYTREYKTRQYVGA
jgi:DNA-binding transcriptional regulator WhiA